jgi:chaperonin cofactor prefoldin
MQKAADETSPSDEDADAAGKEDKVSDEEGKGVERVAAAAPREDEDEVKVEDEAEAADDSYLNEKSVYLNEDGEIIVDMDHPEITASVNKVVEQLQNQPVTLAASEYIEVLHQELERLRKEKAKLDPNAPRYVRLALAEALFRSYRSSKGSVLACFFRYNLNKMN